MKNIILAALIFANAYVLLVFIFNLNPFLFFMTAGSLILAARFLFDSKNIDTIELLKCKKIFCYYLAILFFIVNAYGQSKYPEITIQSMSCRFLWISSMLFFLCKSGDFHKRDDSKRCRA